jgi:endonuclease/exonuclease/phosphatase family metal-dependent hydrolase
MFRLDRIYSRGLHVEASVMHHGLPWSKISDHAAVSARFSFESAVT